MFQISYGNDKRFGDLEIENMFASSGVGHHRLGVTIAVRQMPPAPKDAPRPRLTDIRGRLSASAPTGGEQQVARLAPAWSFDVQLSDYGNSSSFQIEAELSTHQVAALEVLRGGAGLNLSFWLTGGIQYGTEYRTFQGGLNRMVNQGEWIDLLRTMGFQDTLLIEVPRPSQHEHPELAEAVSALREANDSFRHGRYRQTVAECRRAVEALHEHFGEPDFKVSEENPNDWYKDNNTKSLDDRLKVLRKSAKLVCASAPHSKRKANGIQWDPEDAELMLAVAAALVAHATRIV